MELLKSHKSFGGVTEFFEHESKWTKTLMKLAVSRPENVKDIKGGLIWLSGLTCNEENFITKAGAQRVANELGLVIVCPDTSPRGTDLPGEHETYDFGSGAGFYVDSLTDGYKGHYNMYSYVNEEIYALLNERYNLKSNISIFGHSMGGHGALTIGLKNLDKYKSISAFAPIVNPVKVGWGQKAFRGYLGDDENLWKAYDACELIKEGAAHSQKILIDQGLDDEFLGKSLMTKNIEEVCEGSKQGLEVNYRKGYDHSYYFISTFMEDHLKFHKSFLV
ncbi:MAG: S-formylglutathione hydrolase [Bdellovibrionales bacterium]